MRGERNRTRAPNRVIPIQSPTIPESFFQQFGDSNIALAVKMGKTVKR